MSLPEFVTPVLSIAGPPALVFVIMRCFPQTARAVVVLLAGIVAIVTRDPKRRAACHKVLDTLTRRDSKPPPPLSPSVYGAVSCWLISAIRDSGEFALIVAMGEPLGRAHQTVWLGQHRTAQRSHFGYRGRSIASCLSSHDCTATILRCLEAPRPPLRYVNPP